MNFGSQASNLGKKSQRKQGRQDQSEKELERCKDRTKCTKTTKHKQRLVVRKNKLTIRGIMLQNTISEERLIGEETTSGT
jgi:hypothetical protein